MPVLNMNGHSCVCYPKLISMKLFSFLFLSLFSLLIACRSAVDPGNVSYAFREEEVTLGGVFTEQPASLNAVGSSRLDRESLFAERIKELQKQVVELKRDHESVKSESFDNKWNEIQKGTIVNFDKLSDADVKNWVILNDSLLKYSGEQRFAEELEKMAYNVPIPEVITEKMIKSFCYTRLYDRIYVNILGSSEVEYEHTTGGKVRVIQHTKYPFDGRITIQVATQDTRYLDLFIRIPKWAEQSSVTLRGVMYNTIPGNYTEIARKWKNGETVEIVLGFRPDVIRNDSTAMAFTFGPMFLSYLAEPGKSMVFRDTDPIKYLKLVSPTDEMPTFTFSGIPNETLVLQPFFARQDPPLQRKAWIKTTPE